MSGLGAAVSALGAESHCRATRRGVNREEKKRAEPQRKNVPIVFEEDRQGGAVNGPRFYFHDPDGNVLEIIDLTSYIGAA